MKQSVVVLRGRTLIGMLIARHPDALESVRSAFEGEVGIVRASELLEIDQRTLRRHARDWPELWELVEAGTIDPDERAARGGAKGGPACADKRWGKGWRKRNG